MPELWPDLALKMILMVMGILWNKINEQPL